MALFTSVCEVPVTGFGGIFVPVGSDVGDSASCSFSDVLGGNYTSSIALTMVMSGPKRPSIYLCSC